MAFVPQLNQDDEEQQGGQAAQGPQQLGPQGGAITGSAPAAGASQGGQKRSFSNINQYLQQNQPQSAKLGEKVGGFVGQQLDSAQQGLQQGQEQFNKQLGENKRTFNADLVNQAGADPTKLDEGQFGQLKSKLSGSYEGPSEIDNNVFNQTQKAVGTANLGGSEEGRKQLLQQVQNPRRASAGVSSLNNLLLQNNPQAQAQIQAKQEQAKQLQQNAEKARSESSEQVKAAQAQNQQVAQQTKDAFLGEQGFVNKFKSSLDEKTQAAKMEADKRSAQAQALLRGGADLQMTPEARAQALADIGISDEEYGQISRAYNPLAGQSYNVQDLYNQGGKRGIDAITNYLKGAGKKYQNNGQFLSVDGRKFGYANADQSLINEANDWYNQQNKMGKYAEQMDIGTKDLSDLATIGGYNPDMNALRQQVATKDDLAKQNAFNQLLGLEDNTLYDSQDLGSFNPDLVNFDRLRAGLK